MTMAPKLVCLGNFTLDDVVLPDGSERPGCTGGDALYATLAARPWEPRTELVAPVGNDLPARILEQMKRADLSDAGLTRRDLPTLHNRVEYFADGARKWTLFASEDDFDVLSPRPMDIPHRFRNADAFLILAMTLGAQRDLVETLRKSGATVALDPQEDYISGNERHIRAMIGGVDIFLPSTEEVQRLLGHDNWSMAAQTFAELGPSVVVIKLGAEGCLVYERDSGRETRLPAYPVERVIDTTGAGDSFCGAFMATYLQDPARPDLAARAGAVAASFTVAGYGVDPLFDADADEMRQRLANWPLS